MDELSDGLHRDLLGDCLSVPFGVTRFAVHAVNSWGISKGITIFLPAPTMPSGVSAVATLSSGTSFSWNAATGASQYDLMSCNSGTKPWTKLATIAR